MELSETELMAAWAGGDAHAGVALIERHFDTVYRFLSNKLQNPHLDDVVQRTFLGCIEARQRFRGDSSFRTFLFQVARHQLYAYLREIRRDQCMDLAVTSLRELDTSPTSHLGQRDNDRLLAEALQSLPLELQLVLELSYWENLTAAEVASVLEIPENTVYTRIHRAKILLHQALCDAGAVAGAKGWATRGDDVETWMRALRQPGTTSAVNKRDKPGTAH